MQNNKYSFYTTEDFVNDEAFWLYVIEEDPKQISFWENFLKENPAKRAEVEEARSILIELNQPQSTISEERIKQLWNRIEESQENFEARRPGTRLPGVFKNRQWMKMAAMITLLLISCTALYIIQFKSAPVTLATTYGERKEFRLPDGSVVLLNANSEIQYNSNWGTQTDREVWLKGEGFFSIQHKENNQKFIVHAGELNIKVLGTTFNVNHRREEVKVVLSTGKVALETTNANGKDLILKPGDFVTYQEQQEKFIKKTVNPDTFLAWKNNLLQFQAESLENIFQLLQDNYNLTIITNDSSILNRKFTGTVPADDLSVLFSGLEAGHNLEIAKTGNTVRIRKNIN